MKTTLLLAALVLLGAVPAALADYETRPCAQVMHDHLHGSTAWVNELVWHPLPFTLQCVEDLGLP